MIDPSVPVFQLAIAAEIHQYATKNRTACGLGTALGVSTTWEIAARYSPPCQVCWPDIDEESK